MGFALQVSPISAMVSSDEDEVALRDFLARNGIAFVDTFDPKNFSDPFFEFMLSDDPEEDDSYAAHVEVGWSWWSITQKYMVRLLGEERVRNALSVHAWYGVACPGDFEPSLIGSPVRRMPRTGPMEGVSSKSGNVEVDQEIAKQIDFMMNAYAGEFENLHLVSGPRLLAEFDAAVEEANLGGQDPLQLYESVDDDKLEQVARCNLLIARKFLDTGLRHRHLVWWRK